MLHEHYCHYRANEESTEKTDESFRVTAKMWKKMEPTMSILRRLFLDTRRPRRFSNCIMHLVCNISNLRASTVQTDSDGTV